VTDLDSKSTHKLNKLNSANQHLMFPLEKSYAINHVWVHYRYIYDHFHFFFEISCSGPYLIIIVLVGMGPFKESYTSFQHILFAIASGDKN
jgi:hypothetical protein